MRLRRFQVACCVAALGVGLGNLPTQAAEARAPTFEKTRPKGPRQLPSALPPKRPAVPEVQFGDYRPFNAVDHFILTRIQEAKQRPRGLCNDWEFARRACLDLVGVIPMAEDVEQYFAWEAKERRKKWVDHLLQQQQYADHWTTFWGNLLRERGGVYGSPENALKLFLHRSLRENRPYNGWVTELLTASGRAGENLATAFVLRDRGDPDPLTVTVSQTFLGVQLRCAQCHDHPFDWWEQKDYQGLAGYWKGTQTRVYDRQTAFRDGLSYDTPLLELGRNDAEAAGVFFMDLKTEKGRGPAGLADQITQRENPYFARVAVNRLWAKMMGVGLVNPVDNFTVRNPPSHPELLDWLAMEFIDSGYNLKHVLRLIATSRTYQQTSRQRLTPATAARRTNADEGIETGVLFDGMLLRRMSAEQIHDSLLVATGRYLPIDPRFQPSIQVMYPPNPRSFLSTFGCSDRETLTPPPESASIPQALTLLNGELIQEAIRLHPGHPLTKWRQPQPGPGVTAMVDRMFVQILTRPPTVEERALAMQYIGAGIQHDWRWEDFQWALLNTREFQFIQ